MATCAACGNETGDTQCPRCGAFLPGARELVESLKDASSALPPDVAAPPKAYWKAIAVFIAVPVALFVLFFLFSAPRPVDETMAPLPPLPPTRAPVRVDDSQSTFTPAPFGNKAHGPSPSGGARRR